jgi:hypothetical protein
MVEAEEIKDELIANVESELDAWEGFYKKFKKDYEKIGDYEKKIANLQDEIEKRDSLVKRKLERERGSLLLITAVFIIITVVFMELVSNSLNVWLYFFSGVLIGLGGFLLLYLWTR